MLSSLTPSYVMKVDLESESVAKSLRKFGALFLLHKER